MRLERKLSSLPTANNLKVCGETPLRLGRSGPFPEAQREVQLCGQRSEPKILAGPGASPPLGLELSLSSSEFNRQSLGGTRTRCLVLHVEAKRGENDAPSRRSLVHWTPFPFSPPSFRLASSLRAPKERSRAPPPPRRPSTLHPIVSICSRTSLSPQTGTERLNGTGLHRRLRLEKN